MIHSKIYITQPDADKIRYLLREAIRSGYRGSKYIYRLQAEIDRAAIVMPQGIAPNVITLNSKVLLTDLQTGELLTLMLVMPDQADVLQEKVSILAPVGAAMLGYQAGDEFEMETPEGRRLFRVEKVIEQPEATGDYS